MRTALCLLAVAVLTAAGHAETKEEKRDREIQDLKARLERLEREAEDEKIVAGSRLKKVEETQDAVQWSFNDARPTVRSGDGRFELSLRSLVQLDTAAYIQDQSDLGAGYACPGSPLCDLGSGALFRRVRFGVEGKFFREFVYEIRFEFGGSDIEGSGTINLARIGYVGVPGLRVHLGAIQPIMTLYDATSSGELTTMERPGVITVITQAFGGEDGRRGLEATYQRENLLTDGDNFMFSAALTGDRVATNGCGHSGSPSGCPAGADDERTQLLGRLAYRLWSDGTSNVQIGGTAATILSLQGTNPGVDRTLTLRERPEVRVSGDRFVDTGPIPAEGGTLAGFEAGMNFQNLYLAAEYYAWDVERDVSSIAGADPRFSGWYVEGEWLFTGENKRYVAAGTNNNVAVWRGPASTSSAGAWSLTARYSDLNLNWREGAAGAPCTQFLQCIRGGEQKVTNIGVTWYLNANLKMMGEYAMVDVNRQGYAGENLNAEFDIVQGRMQFGF